MTEMIVTEDQVFEAFRQEPLALNVPTITERVFGEAYLSETDNAKAWEMEDAVEACAEELVTTGELINASHPAGSLVYRLAPSND